MTYDETLRPPEHTTRGGRIRNDVWRVYFCGRKSAPNGNKDVNDIYRSGLCGHTSASKENEDVTTYDGVWVDARSARKVINSCRGHGRSSGAPPTFW